MINYAKRQLNVCQNYFSQTSMSFYVANIVHKVLVFEGNNYMESYCSHMIYRRYTGCANMNFLR